MIERNLILAFPFVPLALMGIVAFARYALRRDLSWPGLIANHALQLAIGLRLILAFYDREVPMVVSLTPWQHSIVFQFDRFKVAFMASYLVPLLFSLFRRRQLHSFHLRVLFLFFLGGCSGLIVTGDVFNFFVFYELMIMAAYVLIASRRLYYASVKYMLFGAISSSFFLAGIIVMYAAGVGFRFSDLEIVCATAPANFVWMTLLFSLAFLIKSAFFPVSAWVTTCHAAAVPLVSAFLASFTVFSGVYGLFYLVLIPAGEASYGIHSFLQSISLATLLLPALFVLFEPDVKRCVAGSTIYTIGFIGWLLSHRHYEAAFAYVIVHSVYKSLMFYLLDDVRWSDREVSGPRASLIAGGICVLFTTGWFPSLVHFLKYPARDADLLAQGIILLSALFVAGGFLKFKYRVVPEQAENTLIALAMALLGFCYYACWPHVPRLDLPHAAFDWALLAIAIFSASWVFEKLRKGVALDRKWIFTHLNAELFYVLVLMAAGTLTLLAPLCEIRVQP